MRRKLIFQGNKSYTLTLPIKWIKEQHLDSGDDVELAYQDTDLIVRGVSSKKSERTIELPMSDYGEGTIKAILNQAYRKGFDKFVIKFQKPQQLESIKKITRNNLLGFEVVEEGEGRCVIENIAEPSSEKFHVIFRKVFYIIKQEADEIISDIRNRDYDLKKRLNQKNTLDNLTNFIRRCIVKDKVGGVKKSYLLFFATSLLALIHHSFYYLHKYVASQPKKVSKDLVVLLGNTKELMDLYYEAFYQEDISKAHKLQTYKIKFFSQKLYPLLEKKKGVDAVVLYHLGEITRLIQMSSTVVFGISVLSEDKD